MTAILALLKGDNQANTASVSDYQLAPNGTLPADQANPTVEEVNVFGAECAALPPSTTPSMSQCARFLTSSMQGSTYFNTLAPPNWQYPSCFRSTGCGQCCDRNGVVAARSRHPGGVNATMADGKVRFVSESIDQQLWMNVGSKNAGDVVEEF